MARRVLRRLGVGGCRGLSSAGLRVLGMMLIVVGLLLASMAFVPDGGGGEGVIVIFPFVFGNVSGWAAVVFTVAFFVLFILSSLLPWYVVSKRSRFDDRFVTYRREGSLRGGDSDAMEYIITTELPRRLRRSVYIEADGDEIRLRSTKDESFHRSYTLPRGFEVDEIDSDYEGGYLIMKLLLKRII